jgi:hypothetical protein
MLLAAGAWFLVTGGWLLVPGCNLRHPVSGIRQFGFQVSDDRKQPATRSSTTLGRAFDMS